MVSDTHNHPLPAARLLALSNTNIPFKRLFVEGFVIVISILLAFAIDAWWDRQQESEQEAALLMSLLADFRLLEEQLSEADRKYLEEHAERAAKAGDYSRSALMRGLDALGEGDHRGARIVAVEAGSTWNS